MNLPSRFAIALACAFALAPTAAQAATPEWFTLPEARTLGGGVTTSPDGAVWFGVGNTGGNPPPLGRLTPAAATPGTANGIDYFPSPAVAGEGCCANFVRSLAFDATRGHLWFTRSTGVYGYATPASMVPGTENGFNSARLPSGLNLGGIALQEDGTAWFAENGASNTEGWPGNRMASTSAGLGLSELPNLAFQTGSLDSSRYDAKPSGVTIAPDGGVWFAESTAGLPGYRIAKVAGAGYQEYLVTPCAPSPPCSGSNTGQGPTDVAAAPDGSIWFTNLLKRTVGRLDPAGGTITQYTMGSIDPTLASGDPRAITLAPDGTLWMASVGFISNPGANAIVRIVPTDPPTATVYKTGAGKTPLGIAPDTKGNVWFTARGDSQPDFVGRLAGVTGAPTPTPTPTPDPDPGTTTPPPAATPGPTPGPVILKPATTATAKIGDPRVRAGSLSVNQICVGPPADKCSLIYLLDAHEYVTGYPGTRASSAKKRKTRRVVVGRKVVTLKGGQKSTAVIKLNAKGRKILKRDGKLNATLRVTRKLPGGKKKKLKTKKVRFR